MGEIDAAATRGVLASIYYIYATLYQSCDPKLKTFDNEIGMVIASGRGRFGI